MIRTLLTSTVMLLLFASCEKEVEVEMPEYQPVLVVNSFLEADSIPHVEVLFSRSITDTTTIKRLQTSDVELYENNTFLGKMLFDTLQTYSLPGFRPLSGKEYKVIVKQTGFEEVTATTYCPVATEVNSYSITKGAGTNFNNEPLARLNLNFNDPGEKSYYFVRMNYTRMDTFYIDSVNYTVYPNTMDIYIDGSSSENNGENFINGGFLANDELYNGRNHSFNLYFNQYVLEDTTADLHVYFSTVSREYYDYFRTLNLQQVTSFNPFSEPARVYSNIENGLGIFGSVTTRKYKIQ